MVMDWRDIIRKQRNVNVLYHVFIAVESVPMFVVCLYEQATRVRFIEKWSINLEKAQNVCRL